MPTGRAARRVASVVVSAPIVTTSAGQVSGRIVNRVYRYLGIPYAAPPVGEAAFAAPAPPESWAGLRQCDDYGPTAPQVPYPDPIAALLSNVIALGDTYLNLNVWTPDPGAGGLPVMVWIHGGAFTRGSNRMEMYAGDTFARDGVVCVGINYRLGTAGFASVAGAPENRGLLDQIAALRWVHDNIAAFGGDPDNVTLFGESAGAMSIASLLSAGSANGLFARAIMQSGNGNAAADPADARKVTARLAEVLGVNATVASLGQVGAEALLKAQTQVALEVSVNPDPQLWGPSVATAGLGIMSQFPVIDGELLTARPQEAVAAGAGAGIPLLAGWNADEFRFFLVPTGGAAAVTEDAAAAALGRLGMSLQAERQRLDADATAGDVLVAALTYVSFSGPTTAIAEARPGSPTYLYEFGYPSPQADIRAGHAVEIPFVFDHLAGASALVGPDPDQGVADEMHSAWVRFAQSGDPGWRAHRGGDDPHRFG